MALNGSIHGGHRERLKDRFLNEGLDGFEEHNILEILLFYAVPQKDTNELAHALLARFGSLSAVFSAEEEELMQVEGVAKHTACYLRMYSDLIDAYLDDRQENALIVSVRNIVDHVVRLLAVSEVECLVICFIDNKETMISRYYILEGYVSPELLDTKSIIRMVLGTNATHAVLARNYLQKKPAFGKKDFVILGKVSDALRKVGIGLYDYIITGRDRTYKAVSEAPETEPYRLYLS